MEGKALDKVELLGIDVIICGVVIEGTISGGVVGADVVVVIIGGMELDGDVGKLVSIGPTSLSSFELCPIDENSVLVFDLAVGFGSPALVGR